MDGPRSVADVLNDHVVFEVECIDRMYCTIDISGLQYTAGLVGYIHQQLGLSIASTAPVAKISDRFSAAVHRFARDRQVPWVDFVRGQRKDDVMHEYLTGYTQTQGVVFIGRAQEKSTVFRAEKRRNAQGVSYPWIVKSTGMVNHYYFYCVDEDFGPFLVTFCSYFPYNARLCLQRKSLGPAPGGKAGIGFTPLDNAFAQVDDPAGLQQICDRLGTEQINALLDKWLALLPNPFTNSTAPPGTGRAYQSCRPSCP